jgi:VanZ family protein
MSLRSAAHLATRGLLVLTLVIGVWAAMTPVQPTLLRWDKVDHMAWFTVATTLISLSFPTVKLRWLLLVMMVPAIGGEVIQMLFAPGRSGSWKDAVASYAGAVLALAAIISGKYRTWLISEPTKGPRRGPAGIASPASAPYL